MDVKLVDLGPVQRLNAAGVHIILPAINSCKVVISYTSILFCRLLLLFTELDCRKLIEY